MVLFVWCIILHAMLCNAQTKRGAACPRQALEAGFCHLHDPEKVAERTAAGGRARARVLADAQSELAELKLDSVDDVRAIVREALRLVKRSKSDGCAKARVLLQAAAAALELFRTADLERELRELRELVDEKLGTARAE